MEGTNPLFLNKILIMKKTSPIKTAICPAATKFNKYKQAPINKTKMPNNKKFETKPVSSRKLIFYIVTAIIIILAIYYLPNYFFLEKAIAQHSAFLLNSLGIQVQTSIVGENVFLENIKIVKDCTGIQVIAVFFGLIVPLPNSCLKNKIFTLVTVSGILYGANLLRIALEFSLVYFSILPWSLAHYPLSLLLGIIGVIVLVLVANRLLPEFSDFFFEVTKRRLS